MTACLVDDFNCPVVGQEIVGPKICRHEMNRKEASFRLIGKTRAERYLELCLRAWVKVMFVELRNFFSFPLEQYVLALSQDHCLPLSWVPVTFCLSCTLFRAVRHGLPTAWDGWLIQSECCQAAHQRLSSALLSLCVTQRTVLKNSILSLLSRNISNYYN